MSIINFLKRLFGFSDKDNERLTGKIKFFDRKKRFGFVVSGNKEYFFHAAATKPRDFRALQDGRQVTFIVINGKKGPQADKIEIVR